MSHERSRNPRRTHRSHIESGRLGPRKRQQSGFFEQLVEHAFISEILQEVYFGSGRVVEVLRSEVDAYGYDLVLECNGVTRHVQLKTSKSEGRTAVQKVHAALAEKPSGCVVWVIRHEDSETRRMRMSYRFFGGPPGMPLPSLTTLKVAKHTKGDKTGTKKERPAIRLLPKGKFIPIETTGELVVALFGKCPASSASSSARPRTRSPRLH